MKKEISPLSLKEIKVAAKRLKKTLPEKKHSELLDIATYQFFGFNSFREAVVSASKILKKRPVTDKSQGLLLVGMMEESRSITYGQANGQRPTFKRGDWYFYPKDRVLVFEGEFVPYIWGIDRLSDSCHLLDLILQIQKKKWAKSQIEGTTVSPTYQLDELITLIDELCQYYFNSSIQGVFSPSGKFTQVSWPENLDTDLQGERLHV